MGGMKSGTGDVWGDDEDEGEDEEPATEEEAAASEQAAEDDDDPARGGDDAARSRDSGFPEADAGQAEAERSSVADADAQADESTNDIAIDGSSDRSQTSDPTSADSDGAADSDQPYIVRRMLKDKSVQFERDERLTLFVHDDVKSGEQELEAEAQELFGRDIPVFDIREAVYRAALRNRDDVVDELERMGYTRD